MDVLVIRGGDPLSAHLRENLSELGLSAAEAGAGDIDAEGVTASKASLIILDNIETGRLVELADIAGAAGKRTLAAVRAQDCRRLFDVRVDDFIVRPWEARELELRVKRLMPSFKKKWDVIIGGLTISHESYEAEIDGQSLKLAFKEFELLKFLASNEGRVLTRQVLLNQIWDYDYYGGMRTVDVHVRRLRAKLGPYGNLIKTVRQVGYKFDRQG